MSEKWQQINVRLDAELAQALRDMKQGHDESLSEVVIRLLRKLVRKQSPLGAYGAPAGRSGVKGTGARGGFGAGRRGKAVAPGGRAAAGVAGKGKVFPPRAAPAAGAWVAAEGKRRPVGAPPRAPRKFTGKPGKAFRPQQLDGSGEGRKRSFRAGAEGPRSFRASEASDELGAAGGRPRRPRKAKGTRSNRG
jgi:hypothetical protein